MHPLAGYDLLKALSAKGVEFVLERSGSGVLIVEEVAEYLPAGKLIGLDLFSALHAKGIRIMVSFLGSEGMQSADIGADDVIAWLSDVDDVTAHSICVSVGEYREWVESAGFVKCSALTQKRKRCKALVPGSRAKSAKDWALRTRIGELCSQHGA